MKVYVEMTNEEYEDYKDYINKKWEFTRNLCMLQHEFVIKAKKIDNELYMNIGQFNNFVNLVRDLGTKYFEVKK